MTKSSSVFSKRWASNNKKQLQQKQKRRLLPLLRLLTRLMPRSKLPIKRRRRRKLPRRPPLKKLLRNLRSLRSPLTRLQRKRQFRKLLRSVNNNRLEDAKTDLMCQLLSKCKLIVRRARKWTKTLWTAE